MRKIESFHNSRRQGNTIVEAALVLLLSLMVIIAVLDMAQMLLIHQALVERVRAGARYAAVNDWSIDSASDEPAANKIRNVVVHNKPSPGVAAGQKGMFGIDPLTVTVTRQDLPIGPTADDENAGLAIEGADRITVSITGHRFFFLTPGLTGAYMSRPVSRSIAIESLGRTL